MDSVPLWYQSCYLTLDRHRDLTSTNSSLNQFSTKTLEDLSKLLMFATLQREHQQSYTLFVLK